MTAPAPTGWLMESAEPWTRYRTLVDLDHVPDQDPQVAATRRKMIRSERVEELVASAAEWPGYPLRRHNDAAHPLYAMTTLADFGLDRNDPGIEPIADSIMTHFDGAGFETLLWLPRFLTKEDDREGWAWMECDAPTLLYVLISFGFATVDPVERAVSALLDRVDGNGWRCAAAASLPAFSGPGRRIDTCPMATTYSLKVLSLVPSAHDSAAVRAGIDALLDHWEHQHDYKLKMFGIGTDFRKLKYPFVWYDILHVADVLSRFESARRDPRLRDMWNEIAAHADDDGRYTAGSMYRAWKGWSFADKRSPSPWLTFLVLRIGDRLNR